MRNKLTAIILIILFVQTPLISAADEMPVFEPVIQEVPQTNYPLPSNSYRTQGYSEDNLKGKVVMVPANTTFTAICMTPLSSETAKSGDNVVFYLGSDFYYGKNLIAGAGSRVNGTVLKANKGTVGSRSGKIEVRFTNIITPNGQVIPITARFVTDDGSGVLKAGTAKDAAGQYVKDVGLGAAAGALLGTALGALSSGSVGRGAIYGTAVGGGMGLINTLAVRGSDVDIPQNVSLDIILDQPITVSSNTPY